MKRTIYHLFLLALAFCVIIYFCAELRADSFNASDVTAALPYPSESETGAFSNLNIMPEVLIDADKYIDQTDGMMLIPSKETGDLYLSNIGQNERRNSLFQKLSCNLLWMPDSGDEGMGLLQTDFSAIFALPLPSEKSPLLLTPLFSYKRFDRKSSDALDLYNAGVDIRWLFSVIERKLSFDAAVSILYSGTFEGDTGKALRYPAHVAAIWNLNPRLKLILGVAYLDRSDDYNWLPIGGLVWTPNPDVNVELLFPVMRIARRLSCFDQWDKDTTFSKRNYTRWIYGAFELGGSSWRYVKNGVDADLDYSDCRLAVGYEHRRENGITFAAETGCVIGRKLKLHGFPKYEPDTAFFIRLRFML
ncbi:MAG: hypothetical protein LBP59_07790 [Planctomycetaceae bacterium]|jgi:hypothetical protein|nr:hypothetical protein [Planctomycetaceae bacterium]